MYQQINTGINISRAIGTYIYLSRWSGRLLRSPNNKEHCHHQIENKSARKILWFQDTVLSRLLVEKNQQSQPAMNTACYTTNLSSKTHAHWYNSGIAVNMETNRSLIGSEVHFAGEN